MINPKTMDGPIPGENFTSDTRNYPWHRPPEITDFDEAIELSIKHLTKKEQLYSLFTMLQAGVSVVEATDMFVTSGIGKGKWTPDFAILLAGPVSHIIKLLADGYGLKYQMGLDDEMPATFGFIQAASEIDPKRMVEVAENVQNQAEQFITKPEGIDQASSPMGGPFGGSENMEQGDPMAAGDPSMPPEEPQSGLMGMAGPTV